MADAPEIPPSMRRSCCSTRRPTLATPLSWKPPCGPACSADARSPVKKRQRFPLAVKRPDLRLSLMEMPLTAGTRLGPYEIQCPLGAGGMGEVYRARDTRIGRTVAIKVARERFSDRFQREVLAIAGLNHPNICTLY